MKIESSMPSVIASAFRAPMEWAIHGILLAMLTLLASYVPTASALLFSEAEIKNMPLYCEARYNSNSEPYRQWSRQLGPDFIHIHHLCDGYGFTARYFKAHTKRSRQEALREAFGNINYDVAIHSKPEFALMPETLLSRGQVLDYLEKPGEPLADMLKAIELNPKMEPPISWPPTYWCA
jgi:hypothetical protein